jgi:adenylate cyclase
VSGLRASTRRRGTLLLRLLAATMAIGAGIGVALGYGFHDAPLLGALVGAMNGVTTGVLLLGTILGAEIFLPPTRVGHALDRAPFLVTVAIKLLIYAALIVIVVGGRLGGRLAGAVAAVAIGPELAGAIYAHLAPSALLIATLVLLIANAIFVLEMISLVGERTLRDIVFGRYHRSRTEERFFLFLDIAGSTPLAERIGPFAVHRFLGEVFRLASDPIDDHHGEVYQYVGDEVVVTWTVQSGRNRARPIACFFAIERALERAAPAFAREFGAVPRLRAALHAGPIISGEVGGSRRAVVYHGDVMNAASRLEQAARDLDRRFLVSDDALLRLDNLQGFALDDLGLQHLRGRAGAIRVYEVAAHPSQADADNQCMGETEGLR